MLKSLVRRIGAVVGVSLLLGALPAQAREPKVAQHALWEVSDPDTTIYRFGTIHLLPEKLQWRTAAFDQAVDQSQQLVVETIVDQENLQPLLAAEASLGLAKGLPPILKRVPAAQVPRLKAAIAKAGLSEKVFDQMKTWMVAIQLLGLQFRDMGLKGSAGPEEILRQQFLAAHKPIGQLETNTEQFGYFDRLSEKAQVDLLEGAIEPQGTASKEFDSMLHPWERGDVKAIGISFNKELSGSPEIRKALLDDRNAHWAKWIEQRLGQPGTVLVAVGAGHLAGPGSVIAKLEKDGYQVKRLQ